MKPHLRAVDVQRIEHQGAPYFLLRDSTEVATQQLLVPLWYGGVLALADGTRELVQLLQEARELYNSPVDEDEADDLFAALAEAGLLEDAHHEARAAEALRAWRAQPYRPLTHANTGYPAQAPQLARQFGSLLARVKSRPIPASALQWDQGVALLSPHIDYPRGGRTYAEVWNVMREAVCAADVAVILATDHKGSDPFTLAQIDYATPYGPLPTDALLRDALVDCIGYKAAYAGELRHRGEHSVELVANWLHHMRQEAPGNGGHATRTLPIVPILTGSLHQYLVDGRSPMDDATLAGVVAVLRAVMQQRRVLIVASGDLAHVGPVFGGAPLGASELEALTREDERLLAAMATGRAEAFLREIRRVNDRNNVCGVAPIFLAMQAAAERPGTCVSHDIAPADELKSSVVTIAGVTFT